ncbi:hypothetical protein KW849_06010 [Pseudomonas sp. PDM26]|uniref:hypothetical protein n=1 Tax=Pseudomonas sp. PDM26 TaxID=2854766 RepID=UPI001C494FA9|nr:hypothetical protein [Pseudomonas sp. PDM26]MBV7545857.1 hypothetical protein [Pseudomonas sp. PDM26]
MNDQSTAGLPLKIFNYEFLCFEAERNPSEPSTRSSIIRDLENHLLHGDIDYSQHELSETPRNVQESGCEKTSADRQARWLDAGT